jgi:hypothetical protein
MCILEVKNDSYLAIDHIVWRVSKAIYSISHSNLILTDYLGLTMLLDT